MAAFEPVWHSWNDASLVAQVEQIFARWKALDGTRRLLDRDAGLWTDGDEGERLGWLDLPNGSMPGLAHVAERARVDGIRSVVLLGMGGSSLAAEVLAETLPKRSGSPAFFVLDSTDPVQIQTVVRRIEPARTLFIVASKSGTTLETRLLQSFFHGWLETHIGRGEASKQFVVITDPGSELDRFAEQGCYALFHGRPDVGGRFSALSAFGLVPGALMGADVERVMAEVRAAWADGRPDGQLLVEAVTLGVVMAAAAANGRDKLTVLADPPLTHSADWIEQLVAESTGKDGRGIIPVTHEPLGPPAAYGTDRLFVWIGSGEAHNAPAELERLRAAGHPVVGWTVNSPHEVGVEFLRWEIATAVAGALMGLNPFDQPDVEATKVATRKITDGAADIGALPRPPVLEGSGRLSWSAIDPYRSRLRAAASSRTGHALLRAHLDQLGERGYLALLAFLPRTPSIVAALAEMQRSLRDRLRRPVTVGYGPRYLHSTGQAHKGGPPSGVFIQLTCQYEEDLPIPDHPRGFAFVEAAQALGDFEVLAARDRPILGVDLGRDPAQGLAELSAVIDEVTG